MDYTIKREWVKTAAIVLLAVLLILTFFSNTIMNHSLPEAAVTEALSGSITAQVRGTGKVTADGTYQVKMDQTRTVRAVMVKAGQSVEAGDVLFVLGSGDSDELEAAEEELLQLQTSYAQAEASLSSTDYTYLEKKIAAAQTALADAKKDMDSAAANYSTDEQGRLEALNKDIKDTQEELDGYNEERMEWIDKLVEEMAAAYTTVSEKETALAAAQEELAKAATEDEKKTAQEAVDLAQTELDAANKTAALKKTLYDELTTSTVSSGSTEPEIIKADTLLNNITSTSNILSQYQSEYDNLLSHCTAYKTAKAAYDAAEDTLASLQNELATKKASDAQTSSSTSAQLSALSQQIAKQQEKIAELSGGTENEIVAEVAGTVDTVTITAGNSAKKGDVICTIEVPDGGYSVSFTVTNDQAKLLHTGDTATVTNYYWGSEITATLTTIARDPTNPATNKLLTFDVTGDVTAGSDLTITVGSRSATYDLVVPSSAIRSDTNGSFVLAITEKSSALGNRYFATRVPVEVIAKDDTNSAVSGDLESGTFVITTSNKPVKAGEQVRLAD